IYPFIFFPSIRIAFAGFTTSCGYETCGISILKRQIITGTGNAGTHGGELLAAYPRSNILIYITPLPFRYPAPALFVCVHRNFIVAHPIYVGIIFKKKE